MKRLLLLTVAAAFVACGQKPAGNSVDSIRSSDGVEVLSFHAKKRCPTCIAIENLTREVVEADFAAQLADSSLVFRVVNISEEEALADKYEVTWSSLLVIRHRKGAERVTDLTESAFANARSNPEKFKAELRAAIRKQLDR